MADRVDRPVARIMRGLVVVVAVLCVLPASAARPSADAEAVASGVAADGLQPVLLETKSTHTAGGSTADFEGGDGPGLVDSLIGDIIQKVKAKRGASTALPAGDKATILENANVLKTKEQEMQWNDENKMKKTREEANKLKRQDIRERDMEERQKKLESEAKRRVAKDAADLLEAKTKTISEQGDKARDEEHTKTDERRKLRRQEESDKTKIRDALVKSREEAQKADDEITTKRRQEVNRKRTQEAQVKTDIAAEQRDAERRRQEAQRELLQKKQQEQEQKNQARKAEEDGKAREKAQEEQAKLAKKNEKANWCDCKSQQAYMNTAGWKNCDDGYLLTGFYRGSGQTLSDIFYFHCCKPCDSDNNPLRVGTCSHANWWSSFDNEGWSLCPHNTYMKGIYKNNCDPIYCIEEANCCMVENSRGEANCNAKASWGSSFDSQGWSVTDDNFFLRGLYRSGGGHNLYNIEYPMQCQLFARP